MASCITSQVLGVAAALGLDAAFPNRHDPSSF
jgi:hypothetical protein